jgi:hypothetical protein
LGLVLVLADLGAEMGDARPGRISGTLADAAPALALVLVLAEG